MKLKPAVAKAIRAAGGGNLTGLYAGANPRGGLDCNGFSPAQAPAHAWECTDIRGRDDVWNANTWGGRFYDNGHYIGHDEPDTTFLSRSPGSGGNVTWTFTLGRDPSALPTDSNPGHDVSHWFELTPAPWLSMAICDPNSNPLLPCTPNNDANAPQCASETTTCSSYPGAGSAFMEMQFYPPGEPPFADSISCDDAHWCAALTIDSLECTWGYAQCNTNCEEPVNFAFIQRDGVPTGPPAPQNENVSTETQNGETLLMNPGDTVRVHMWDAPVPGVRGQKALEIYITDLTTGQSGFMQASAKNGFQNTSIVDCSGTPFNFQPEYSTASYGNWVPWAALQTDISTEFETGHWESCNTLSDPIDNPLDPSDTSQMYNKCSGPYETAGGPEGDETGDAICWYAGDTHNGFDGPGSSSPPDLATGCQDNIFQNGDLDYDGQPYWTEWPTGTKPTIYPASFVESLPSTDSGQGYPKFFFQTDTALSETPCTENAPSGCTIPPVGPGHFYPYWSEAYSRGSCTFEFGNVSQGVNDYGKDAQYGTDRFATLGYPEFESKIHDNNCPSGY